MKPLISIIVPVYNVEKYLDRCLVSIEHQTYENLEIIIVDDGTKDNCTVIYEKHRLNDNRIRIIRQMNRGLSAARNTGLDVAKGE